MDDLIYKVLNKEASDKEVRKLNKWKDVSPENRKKFLEIERLWNKTDEIKDYYKIDETNAWTKIYTRIQPKQAQKILFPLIKIAAVVVIAYILGVLSMYLINKEPINHLTNVEEIHIKAPLGSKTEVELTDGTKLWLNSGSEIRYPAIFAPKQREVFLIGEAYFDVAKNKEVPFFVHTNEIDIKVLGTRFNVKSYPEEGLVETILEEGSININKKGSDQILYLKPNQKATFVKSLGDIKVSDYSLENLEELSAIRKEQFILTENIDTEPHTSWKNERLVFKREKFDVLAVKMERWYNVQITLENDRLKEERVTGIFEKESIEQALDALQISLPFTYEMDKNQIIIK